MGERLGGGGEKEGVVVVQGRVRVFSGEQDFRCGLSERRLPAQERPEQPDSQHKLCSL